MLKHTLFTPYNEEMNEDTYKFEDRLVARDTPFCQSSGYMRIDRKVPAYLQKSLRRLYYRNLFHTLIDVSIPLQMLIFACFYLFMWIFWAFWFWMIDENCGLGLEGNFLRAYYLSIETTVTIGYGVPDPYFNDCPEGAILLTLSSLVSLFVDGVLIGFIFLTLTNPQRRASTVIFTDKAIIKLIDGQPHFMFQV